MRVRRSLRCGFVTVLCSLCAAPAAHAGAAKEAARPPAHARAGKAAKPPTVAGELKSLAAAGALAPADYDADRSTYSGARAEVKRLTGARRLELSGVIRDLEDMAARRQLTASR